MTRRRWRVAGGALILAALGLATVGGAAGAEQIGGLGACAAPAVAPRVLKASELGDTFSVGASAVGQTGVFFLTRVNPSRTFVVKFERAIDDGVALARALLQAAGLRHDRLLGESIRPSELADIAAKIDAAAAVGRIDAADPAQQAAVRTKAQALKAGVGGYAHLLITEYVQSAHGQSDLNDAMRVQPWPQAPANASPLEPLPSLPANEALREVEGVIAGLRALARPENQRFLGALYVLDAYLGNADRITRGKLNLGNLMLTEDGNGDYCLVAIDNEAYAPDPEYANHAVVAKDLAENVQAAANGQIEKRSNTLDKASYFRGIVDLTNDYFERGKDYAGPRDALLVGAMTLPAGLHNCWEGVTSWRRGDDDIMDPALAALLRLAFQTSSEAILSDLRAYRTDVFSMGPAIAAAAAAVPQVKPGRPVNSALASAADLARNCMTSAAFQVLDSESALFGKSGDIAIDWGVFERNVLRGARAAVAWLTQGKAPAPRDLVKAKPKTTHNAVSREGLALRLDYLKALVERRKNPSGPPLDQVGESLMDGSQPYTKMMSLKNKAFKYDAATGRWSAN